MPANDQPLPGEPQEHMDVLLDFLIRFAQRALAEDGGFAPFGATMAPDGELGAIGGSAVEGDPTAPALFESIVEGLHERASAGGLLATAICVDVTLTEHEYPLGIRVDLEHRDAEPLTCILPYRRDDDGYRYGELIAYPGERRTLR